MSDQLKSLKARLTSHLETLFPPEAVQYIVERVLVVTNLYDQPPEALSLAVERMEKISKVFSSKQLLLFLKRVNPTIIRQFDFLEIGDVGLDAAKCIMEGAELAEYRDYYHRRKAEAISQRKADMLQLQDDYIWEILTSKNWRKIKPSTGHVNEMPRARAISTPMGGQPKKR
ncbi:hypothetical protein HON36_02905 [Candidatus Parcubacteria bacterium]|nr:hypothetical protein [Candidatus Parcubacteria bacterium]MBT7228572.1 hypothetical protein [Candidatus Parcubacteria bacterium]